MNALTALWDFAPDLKIRLLCLALAGQVIVTLTAYFKLSKARMTAVKAKQVEPDVFKSTRDEPEQLRVFTRAVANQFELPVIFYALIAASLALRVSSWLTVLLAFAFVALRCVHLQEMTGENRVFRRRRLFIRGMQVVLLMLVELLLSTMLFAQG